MDLTTALAADTDTRTLHLEAMLDAMPAFAALVRANGAIHYVNRTLATACGWSREEGPSGRLQTLVPAEVAVRLLDPSGTSHLRAPLRANEGAACLVEWSARALDGGFILITGRDISREVDLERYIVDNQWFETASALSGGLAHDFNNVLAAILGLSEIIVMRLPPDSPIQGFASRIGGSINRAKGLVRRFSQFSRKGPGIREAQPTALVLQELAPLIKGFLPGNIPLETTLAEDTPWCLADRQTLEHILLNCTNALRTILRTNNGSLHLSSRASEDKKFAEIELRASGQGLLGMDIEKLFHLDLRPTASAYESGSAVFTARELALRHDSLLEAKRIDPRTVSFVLSVPVAE